jgi:hypothetical protein
MVGVSHLAKFLAASVLIEEQKKEIARLATENAHLRRQLGKRILLDHIRRDIRAARAESGENIFFKRQAE